MTLNDMTLSDLLLMQRKIETLQQVGMALYDAGLEPTFHLTPGGPASISLPMIFDADDQAATVDDRKIPRSSVRAAIAINDQKAEAYRAFADSFVASVEPSEAPLAVASNEFDPAETTDEDLDHDIQPELAPVAPEARTDRVVPISEPTVSGVLSAKPLRWSTEEDEKAVALFVGAPHVTSFEQKANLISATLGRPVDGVKFRLRKVLGDKIEAAMRKGAVKAPPRPEPVAAVPPSKKDPAADQIHHHLLSLRRSGSHQIGDDLEMMEAICDGMDTNTVAGVIGGDAAEVKRRFDALTGVYKDANDKPCRKYSREQVLAALRFLMKAGGKAA